MIQKKIRINILIVPLVFIISLALFTANTLNLSHENDLIEPEFNVKTSSLDYTNATIISDGIQNIIWNDGMSRYPEIAIDSSGNLHAVWADDTDGSWGNDSEVMYANHTSSIGWSFAKVISDGYNNVYWNDEWSGIPDIAIDSLGYIHVVWADYTDGIWGIDSEIMYAKYTTATGWSNATVISDGYNNAYWNNDDSSQPAITIDNNDKIHVVFGDNSNGVWGYDSEIMYTSYTLATGWTNVSIISDGYNSIYWNDGSSWDPAIASDNIGNIHVVWEDDTNGVWGLDWEIMYAIYKEGLGWSNATIISDGINDIYWNDGSSENSDIAIDSSNIVHVVWDDSTDGAWGSDDEIMYTNYNLPSGWAVPIVISDGYNSIFWNNGESVDPSITVDPSGTIHVAWEDDTLGIWGGGDGIDEEIMYANYTEADGWSDATVISDGVNGSYWNDHMSQEVSIVADANNVHVVWHDFTPGVWGVDAEIMYTSIPIPPAAGGNGISFGSFHLLFTFILILGLVIYLKKKTRKPLISTGN
ncbi:MAG: hypothetical protein KGD65_03240 [Candidatus Lokiarchaeota archaeon]|nr:hypothetical protein [Candidatus Lokiarchaeota archaeon]